MQFADLPCGGCKYCTRAHEKWQDFEEEVDHVTTLVQLFQEIPTDDPAVGGCLTNVESKVKELLGQGVWDDNSGETTLPSVRLFMNKDVLEGSNALAEKQVCQVKSVIGENLSDKGFSLSSFSADELTEAQKQDGNLEHLSKYLVSGAVPFAEEIFRSNPEGKCYHLKRDCFRLDDSDVIWRQTGDSGDS